jgi:uncharacterized protein YceH (UPF0502 family)
METALSAIEARVLGALMEKARTTPEVYPLTLNSLVNACNQKTSRDPVTRYDEDEVTAALDSLREKRLAMRVDMAGSRTAKFRENAGQEWQLERPEYALLTILLLRGAQTPGQLRQRSERLFPFGDLQQVVDVLAKMRERDEEPTCLVQSMGRAPGTKEVRYAQTLSPVDESLPAAESDCAEPTPERTSPGHAERLAELETTVAQLQERILQLEQQLHERIS